MSLDYVHGYSVREGTRDLRRAAEDDGTFCYTFFKAVGFRSSAISR